MTTRGRKVDYRALAGMKPATVQITKKVRVRPMKDTQKAQTLQLVKRMISKDAENKSVGYVAEQSILHNSPITSADCEPLVSPIEQGVDQFQRIGDKIKPKSLAVRGTLALNGSSLTGGYTNVPLQVRVLILSQKDIKVGSQILAGGVDTAHLLEPNLPGVNETDFSGTTVNALLPVNKDLFRVYMDKTFTLCGPQPEGTEAVNRFCVNWSYRFKKLPASLTWDNGNGDYCNNFAPFVAIGYSFPDGSSPDNLVRRLVSTVYSRLDYEDA